MAGEKLRVGATLRIGDGEKLRMDGAVWTRDGIVVLRGSIWMREGAAVARGWLDHVERGAVDQVLYGSRCRAMSRFPKSRGAGLTRVVRGGASAAVLN